MSQQRYVAVQLRLLGRAKVVSYCFQIVPFLRCIILNGSLAQGRAKSSSDIDLLIVARAGRIYTVRFATVALAWLLGVKRSKDESRDHAGKVCLNYYLADDYLQIPHGRGEEMDRYCAENYSDGLVIWGDRRAFNELMDRNRGWMGRYLVERTVGSVARTSIMERLPIITLYPLRWVAIVMEWVLCGRLGIFIERWLEGMQVKLIEQDPRTGHYPELIVYSSKELRFHPPAIGKGAR